MNLYVSTRSDDAPKSFTDVLLSGLAPDGGLYVPQGWPRFATDDMRDLGRLPRYADIAFAVIKPFVGGAIPDAVLKRLVGETYNETVFRHPSVTPLVELDRNLWLMELFHGPTLAFKDLALQLLGRLFDHVLGEMGQRVTIVGATSGDTGSAAIEACRACRNIDIFILYPHNRVSEVQRRQMTTVEGDNVHCLAIEGNFDDCQALVKAMFGDVPFRERMRLSAVNSINWARIMAQIAYYFSAALSLGAPDRGVGFTVPTGNFGNIYAAWAARQMGLPVGQLVIASNRNDILTRFFETGDMELGAVEPSLSPSMDIQVSSNFERFLFDLLGRDAAKLAGLMHGMKEQRRFAIDMSLLREARRHFTAVRCSDTQILETIGDIYRKTGYIADPHTAVGIHAARQSADRAEPHVVLGCAHPAKFPDAVKQATGIHPALPPHLADLLDRRERSTVLPNDLGRVMDFIQKA